MTFLRLLLLFLLAGITSTSGPQGLQGSGLAAFLSSSGTPLRDPYAIPMDSIERLRCIQKLRSAARRANKEPQFHALRVSSHKRTGRVSENTSERKDGDRAQFREAKIPGLSKQQAVSNSIDLQLRTPKGSRSASLELCAKSLGRVVSGLFAPSHMRDARVAAQSNASLTLGIVDSCAPIDRKQASQIYSDEIDKKTRTPQAALCERTDRKRDRTILATPSAPSTTERSSSCSRTMAANNGKPMTRITLEPRGHTQEQHAANKSLTEIAPAGANNSTAWSKALAHIGMLRRTTITNYFRKTGVVKSLTGIFHFQHRETLATPSPRKLRAVSQIRDELSWISQTIPAQLQVKSKKSLSHRFVRPMPSTSPEYSERLASELDLIQRFGFEDCFLQVLKILELGKGMPYLIRGSAVGSLVCYMLGISHIDPVKEGMSLARFMNSLRVDLPDIDLDFPHDQRDRIYERLFQLYPSKAARISNHLHFRARSARREAARRMNYHHHIPRDKSPGEFFPGPQNKVYKDLVAELVGTHAGYSLHCGGVVLLEGDGNHIPESDWVPNPPTENNQVKWDKRDCQKKRYFKIDILANRGLTHLWGISHKQVFEYPSSDDATAKLLGDCDVIGILYCESPAMKKALRALRPTCRRELALALAIIRPSSRIARSHMFTPVTNSSHKSDLLVFDDDAIEYIQSVMQCTEAEAETMRKGFSKGNASTIQKLQDKTTPTQEKDIPKLLEHASKYSFCKSHAMSYAHLCWALAYEKAHNTKRFWESHGTAIAAEGQTVYRPWVYKRAGILAGVHAPQQSQKFLDGYSLSRLEQYRNWGFWLGPEFVEGCFLESGVRHHASSNRSSGNQSKGQPLCRFRGLWATGRAFGRSKAFITIGVGNSEFLDLFVSEQQSPAASQVAQSFMRSTLVKKVDVVQGTGFVRNFQGSKSIEVVSLSFEGPEGQE